MKIDVQIAEYLVLEGAKNILKNKKVKYFTDGIYFWRYL